MQFSVTYPVVLNPEPKMLWIECVDPRFARAFNGFRKDFGFNEERDILKKCAGGSMPLAHPKTLPSRFKQLRKNLQFACGHFASLEEIIAIMHEDCGYYCTTPDHCRCRLGKEKEDLPLIGGTLKGFFPGKKIRLVHAGFVNQRTEVKFEEVFDFRTIVQVPDMSRVPQLS